MFEAATQMIVQLIGLVPIYLVVYWLFDLIGGLFFGKR